MAGSWSVVLAAHDGAGFIEQQLRSILDQTVPPDEVLVGDDASTDDTVRIIEGVATSHRLGDRIRLVRRDAALGVVGNFEDLLARATSEFIALSDQDDRWQADRMERLLPRLAADPLILLLHHDAELIDAAGAPLGGLFESLRIGQEALDDERRGLGFERLLRRNLVTGATVVIRHSLLAMAGAVPPGWIHDEWLAIVAAAANGLGVDERRFVEYRQHGANQIGARRLDLGAAVSRFTEDGTERNRRLLLRAQSLADELDRMSGVAEGRRRLSREKLIHEQRRMALPRSRWRRARAAVGEWRTGRYTEFGNGIPDLIRDLVQPRRAAFARRTG